MAQERKTAEVKVRLEPSTRRRLLKLAKESHRTPSGEIRLAIEKHLREVEAA